MPLWVDGVLLRIDRITAALASIEAEVEMIDSERSLDDVLIEQYQVITEATLEMTQIAPPAMQHPLAIIRGHAETMVYWEKVGRESARYQRWLLAHNDLSRANRALRMAVKRDPGSFETTDDTFGSSH